MKNYTLYTAPWCGPCKELKSWLKANNIKVGTHIDIDEAPTLAQDMGIEKVPTLVVTDGDPLASIILEGREQIKPYLEHIDAKG